MPYFLGGLVHATVLAIIGFFILFAATKAQGLVAAFGKILAAWILILAVLAVAGGATAPMFGGRPFGMPMMNQQAGEWMRNCPYWQNQPSTPPKPPIKN